MSTKPGQTKIVSLAPHRYAWPAVRRGARSAFRQAENATGLSRKPGFGCWSQLCPAAPDEILIHTRGGPKEV